MMQQYSAIKEQYADCLLFFRLGDFYELFLDDAELGSRVLGITLTRRPRGKDGDIPMAGVPYHSSETYIARLVQQGYKIAICEQVTVPDGKGIVERKVVRIITPGTVVAESSLVPNKQNYICSIAWGKEKIGCTAVDITTGECLVTEFDRGKYDREQLSTQFIQTRPSECIISPDAYNDPVLLGSIPTQLSCNITTYPQWVVAKKNAIKILCERYGINHPEAIGITSSVLTESLAAVLSYLDYTQQMTVKHLEIPKYLGAQDSVVLDPATVDNLELFETIRGSTKTGSLLAQIDRTKTAGGGRLLRNWLGRPLRDIIQIRDRQQAVGTLLRMSRERLQLQKKLVETFDLERILSRLGLGFASSGAISNCQKTLKIFLEIYQDVSHLDASLFATWKDLPIAQIDSIEKYISSTIVVASETSEDKHGAIKRGVSSELDELKDRKDEILQWVTTYEAEEKKKSGIPTLKCRYNQVFGYYIEVSKSYTDRVPLRYERKQTLVNAERFTTQELTTQEKKFLEAQTQIEGIERALFDSLVSKILEKKDELRRITQALSQLDCIASLAQVAQENKYVCPQLNESGYLSIQAGRHPVVEGILHEQFVANDVELNDEQQLLVITGPNMAGKSVFMRQVAIIVLLAQIGSYVPASQANISLVDRIFVRSGAADNITGGMSTFMVEMVESAHILHQITDQSLVIMDEIGRGTSTYDGISIAWAIAEYLVTCSVRPKVLFATHYHELQLLESQYPHRIKNYHVAVQEHNGIPVFLYTVKQGYAPHSFGIAVARLAGVPVKVINRATELLKKLEKSEISSLRVQSSSHDKKPSERKNVLEKKLSDLDINALTPLQAHVVLAELQAQLRK